MMPGKCPACGKYGLGCDRSAGCHECGYGRRRDVPKPIEMTPEGLEALDDGGACTTGHARNKLPDLTSPAPGSGPEAKPPAPDKATEIYNALKKRMDARLAGYVPRVRGVDLCPCGDRRCVDEWCYTRDGKPPRAPEPPPDKQGAPGARSGDAPSGPTP